MFTLLFGIIKGFFKLVFGAIEFVLGFVLFAVISFFIVKGCCNYNRQIGSQPSVVVENSYSVNPQPHNTYNTVPAPAHSHTTYPSTPFCDPEGVEGAPVHYNNDVTYMFKDYHYCKQFQAGVWISCPVCHTGFYKKNMDHCFCSDACVRRYNQLVDALEPEG